MSVLAMLGAASIKQLEDLNSSKAAPQAKSVLQEPGAGARSKEVDRVAWNSKSFSNYRTRYMA